jgi:hypothetical protein|eukprot:COSAG06_NODE_2397_length_6957_cov_2.660542_8_plen_257_part_00
MAARADRREASEDERNPLTAPDDDAETGLEGEWSAGLSEQGRGGRRNAAEAYKSAAHLSVEQQLHKYKWAVFALAGCACCLTLVIAAGVAMAAGERHHTHHRERAAVTLAMMEQVKNIELQEGRSSAVLFRHQDDMCSGTAHGFFDNILARQCTEKGGICVQNEDDCSNSTFGSAGEGGVIKGKCGTGCGCCFAGCPPQWIGDGECDFACNTAEHHWDGNDCRGASPLFSECPEAWCAKHRHAPPAARNVCPLAPG